MNDEQRDLKKLEQFLQHAARDLDESIPPTPPIHLAVRGKLVRRRSRRRLVAALGFAALVVVLLLSPDVRAVVARFLGLDTVRIVFIETPPALTNLPPSSTPTAHVTTQPGIQPTTRPTIEMTDVPDPALVTITEPSGLISLAEAQARSNFDIRLPDYPPDIGEPERVYFQDIEVEQRGTQQVILIYSDFVLYQVEHIVFVKGLGIGMVMDEVDVNGRRGLWISGAPHLIQVLNADGSYNIETGRIVEGNVLAWEIDDLTFRIETDLPLAEAVRIAESITQ